MHKDGGGWQHVKAGPHLNIIPNRQLLCREPDDIKRPSIVVAVAGMLQDTSRPLDGEGKSSRARGSGPA
jgi:hypothetical protein